MGIKTGKCYPGLLNHGDNNFAFVFPFARQLFIPFILATIQGAFHIVNISKRKTYSKMAARRREQKVCLL
jgi:hypothetical protein